MHEQSALGQLKVCVPGFKVSIFWLAKGKYSKLQKITLLVELYEERRGCGHVWMCSEFSSVRQRHLYNAVERTSAIEELQCEYTVSTYATSAHTVRCGEFFFTCV